MLVRAGGAALTRPETYALEYLRRYGPHGWPARLLRFQPILDREWWRSFGEARFDTIVDFSRHPGIFAWMARLRGPARLIVRQHTDAAADLRGRVCFTGHLRNPFTVLARADCFVLPSLYEGFSQSVAQARLAGLPIVLAGFASAASVSIPDGQLVTGSGAEDLHAALRAFAEGRVPPGGGFEVERHNASALAQWERLLRSR